jgi:oligoribonuclease
MKSEDNLVWIDLETTGLDIEKDKILELSLIITDKDLNVLDEPYEATIHQSEKVIEDMSEWCKINHKRSGLTKKVLKSKTTIREVEKTVLKKIKRYCEGKKCFLAGSSVYFDRSFLLKYMPKIVDYLHYRIIDLTTVRELAKMWCPELEREIEREEDEKKHRAMDDIKKSIEGMKFYREKIFSKV